MKKKGSKMVPNCVPKGSVKKESYHSDWRSELEEGKGMEGMTQKGTIRDLLRVSWSDPKGC